MRVHTLVLSSEPTGRNPLPLTLPLPLPLPLPLTLTRARTLLVCLARRRST